MLVSILLPPLVTLSGFPRFERREPGLRMGGELCFAQKAILVGVGAFEVLFGVAAHAGDFAILGGVEFAVLIGVEAGEAGFDAFGEDGEPGLLVQRRGEFGGVDETVGVRIAGFEVLLAVMLRLHIERQVFGERELAVVVFVCRLENAGDERCVVCGQERGGGEEEEDGVHKVRSQCNSCGF